MKRLLLTSILCGITGTAFAQGVGNPTSSDATASSDYTLFNPVPDDKMRAMSTERPSKSDSTTTLDAGHFQVETSVISYSENDNYASGTSTKNKQWYGGGTSTLRVGLTQSSEFQVLFDAYHDVITSDKTNGGRTEQSGFGDTTLRYKYNFWGNDGGETALAIIPFVKLPTNADNLGNNAYEGGVEFPFLWNFTDGWSLSGQTQLNAVKDTADADYSKGYVNTLVLTHALTSKVSAYSELYTNKTDISPQWVNTADFGVTYQVTDRLEVDTGANFGLSRAADDVNLFTGFAYRF